MTPDKLQPETPAAPLQSICMACMWGDHEQFMPSEPCVCPCHQAKPSMHAEVGRE